MCLAACSQSTCLWNFFSLLQLICSFVSVVLSMCNFCRLVFFFVLVFLLVFCTFLSQAPGFFGMLVYVSTIKTTLGTVMLSQLTWPSVVLSCQTLPIQHLPCFPTLDLGFYQDKSPTQKQASSSQHSSSQIRLPFLRAGRIVLRSTLQW